MGRKEYKYLKTMLKNFLSNSLTTMNSLENNLLDSRNSHKIPLNSAKMSKFLTENLNLGVVYQPFVMKKHER